MVTYVELKIRSWKAVISHFIIIIIKQRLYFPEIVLFISTAARTPDPIKLIFIFLFIVICNIYTHRRRFYEILTPLDVQSFVSYSSIKFEIKLHPCMYFFVLWV
jgi:hypothetical protein